MKIVMLVSNACQPDPRVEKEAAALGESGHSVTIVAWDREGQAPANEPREDFEIERIGPRAQYGAGPRSLGLFREYWRRASVRAVSLGADVVHCHDTDTIVAGMNAVRRLRQTGKPVGLVVDFHELYRASRMVPQRGVTGVIARGIVDVLERRGAHAADLIVVANPGTVPHYERIGGPAELLIVPNAPDMELFRPLGCEERTAHLNVMFVGRKRYARTLEALAEAVSSLPDVSCHLVGGGPDAARVDALAARFERVSAEGPVAYSAIPALYACSDVIYAAYDAVVGNVRYTIPGKVLEAMACAKPVIVSEGTWAAEYVAENRVGVVVDGTDPIAVADALRALRDSPDERRVMGERGRRIVEQGMNWGDAAKTLGGAYGRLESKLARSE